MEDIPKWQRNWEILDIYQKHYCSRLVSIAKELLEDPDLPLDLRPSVENYYTVASVSLLQAYNSPIYPTLLEKLIRDGEDTGGPSV